MTRNCFFLLLIVHLSFLSADEPRFLPRLPRDQLLLYRGANNEPAPVKTTNDWQKRRAEILEAAQDVMGRLPGPEKRCPLNVKLLARVDKGKFIQQMITYESEPGGHVPAYLLIPKELLVEGNTRKVAGILALHPTAQPAGYDSMVGLSDRSNFSYGTDLAERGYVVLIPSYPLLAKYQPDIKHLGWESGTLKAVWDNIRGVDLMETLPYIKPGQFAAIGHSLGGHNSVYTAVFDLRIQVIVSSCGLDSYLDYYDGNPEVWLPEKGWCQTRYMPKLAGFRGRLAAIPFDFHELIGALAPRHTLILAPLRDSNFRAASVDKVVAAAKPVYQLFGFPERLQVLHPDVEHKFTPEMQQTAYQLIDEVLAK